MSARIYVHPRNPQTLLQLVKRFGGLGYTLTNTRRGRIELRPVLNVHQLNKEPACLKSLQ